jgi:CHAT domain-containing protein/Tfp pilus assembly protein PilF
VNRKRNLPRLFFILFLGAACVLKCFSAGARTQGQSSSIQEQITQHEQKLAEARAAKNQKDEGTELYSIGSLYEQAGANQKAVEYFTQVLPLAHALGDTRGEGLTLYNLGQVYDALGQKQNALDSFTQALAIARALHERPGEGLALIKCGLDYFALGQPQKALDFYTQALTITRELRDRRTEAAVLSNIGLVYENLGQKQKALDYYNQALPVQREIADHGGEAVTLSNIGSVYSEMGQKQQALDYFNQALPVIHESRDRRAEASVLSNIGLVYDSLGERQKAIEYYDQALQMQRGVGDHYGEATTLTNIGAVYFALGQMQKALDYYSQALPIAQGFGNRRIEAIALGNLGMVYDRLGQKQKSLDYFSQALPIQHEMGSRGSEAKTLNNIGIAFEALGQKQKAAEYFALALPILHDVGDRGGEAITLSNLGGIFSAQGQKQEALVYYAQALAIQRAVGDRRGEGITLCNIGLVNSALGQKPQELSNYMAALSLAKAVADPDSQGGADFGLMMYFREEKQPEVAILFGLDAVNSFQQMRKDISGLDKELQAGFAKSKSEVYRELAELLVQTDRLAEAEQVLDLLKEQELKEVVRGAGGGGEAKVEPLKLSAAQQGAQNDLAAPEKTAEALTGMSMEYGVLLAKEKRTPEEDARVKTLESDIEKGNSDVSAFFKNTLYVDLAQKAGTQNANAILSKEKSDVSRLQNTLAEMGSSVIGIRLLLGEEHAYAIVVTAHTREKFELKATPAELRSKVLQVRDELRAPSSDPKPHLAELYSMVVAPFADELKVLEQSSSAQSKSHNRGPTLLWSLDGVMRYLPMAALYDGQHYLLERFNNVLFTPESYGHMSASADSGGAKLRVLAMGLSKSYGGLPALPGVMPELDAVVHDPAVPESHGPMEGKLLPNDQFTFAALKTELGAGKSFPVVHIASHFVEEAGSDEEPYLMMGGENSGDAKGYALTLSKMEDSAISFHGTKLLTLSACSTARGDAAEDGQEMDSLGMIAQQKEAEAVLASLWDVNDASTSKLMSDFYSRWVASPVDGKAEALREAQIGLLRGKSGEYAHPFYWAPFILIGNYQ